MEAAAVRTDLELFSLRGKTALVTGGGGVLGSAIGIGLGRAGAKVAFCDLFEESARKAAELGKSKGMEAIGLAVNALEATSISEALNQTEKHFGEIDILVNAAGGNTKDATVSSEVDFFSLNQDALQRVVNLNLFAGAVIPSQVIGKRMAERGNPASIINISSMCAFRPLTRVVGYSAAKAAVSNFTQWLAVYLARDCSSKVRVNAIAPGFLLTEQNRFLLMEEDQPTARGETVIAHTPMGRFGDPEDLMGAVIWLASEASAFVTGVVIPIDGGFAAFSGV
jgi:NAD(P)-dependent dehydrogenase (short-subunit alcohol dehydrogenase family)